jgi:hypothetical protein
MDIISKLCDERYVSLIEGDSGSALVAFYAQPPKTAGIVDIRRQDHPEVPESQTNLTLPAYPIHWLI